MPDFARALKQIDKLNVETSQRDSRFTPVRSWSLSRQLEFLKVRFGVVQAQALPPGETRSNELGSHYIVQKAFPDDYFHGKVRLSRLSPQELEYLMALMRSKVTLSDLDGIVFLDTETTGMQGGVGMCPFLVGLGYFERGDFQVAQFFIRDFDEEPSMLLALGEVLKRFQLVITYNGAAFDLPLLESRFTLARLDSPFESISHFDLLFTARKLWRNGHGSCRLMALERELLSFLREDDVPGAMIPRAYFDYVQRRPSPRLRGVFTHNVYDVVSLAALTVHACDRVSLEPAALDEPRDLYSLGRILENSAEWRRCIPLYEMAWGNLPEPMRQKALESLAVVYRRAGLHDLSLSSCTELMRYAHFSLVGYEGAAVYYERVARDYDASLRVLEEGISRAESIRWKNLLQRRWDRLQQLKLPEKL